MNQRQFSTDATNVLPLEALDIDYYQISYVWVGTYAVIATKDGTEIFENGVSVCGTLNTGDVYYKYTTTDLTGAHITANKPVALFSLQNNVNIPYGYGSPEHLNLYEKLVVIGQEFCPAAFSMTVHISHPTLRYLANELSYGNLVCLF